MYHLYKYKALPIFSDGHLLQLLGSTDLVAMSEDKSRLVSEGGLSCVMLISFRSGGA